MGNQPSHASTPPVGVTTSSHGTQQQQQHQQQHQQQQNSQASQHNEHRLHFHHHPSSRRRESIQALSLVKANPAPPSASLESAAGYPTSIRPLSRGRANTTTQVVTLLRSTASDDSNNTMGNEQSRHKAHSRDNTPPAPKPAARHRDHPATPTPIPTPEKVPSPAPHQQTQQAQPQPQPQAQSQSQSPLQTTRPVNCPSGPLKDLHGSRTDPDADLSSIDAADGSSARDDYMVPSSHFSRPPRLPLPIEEEPLNPGSPILSPVDIASPIDHNEIEGPLPRRTSMLSSTTADDDDLAEEFKGPQGQPTVPTLIEWEGPGERVYVTGTFAGWNRKYRLHRNGPSKKKDVLSAYVHITPGTHHLMFLVDNDMKTSDKLPTAVDYTNILVNYLEVSYDDIPKPATETQKKPASTVPVQEQHPPPGVFPPQTLPPTPELQPVKVPVPEPPKTKASEHTPRKYHQTIPRYLLDLDAPEESSRFARANAATSNLPTPPTLPMFLSKSILNGTTPKKDDSSVLIMPNHTVLNHLATSSIKDNILATSATTRYKAKFLTTIMYKPKEEDPDRVPY